MKLKFLKMYPGVNTPTYATAGAACFDIYAHLHSENEGFVVVQEQAVIETGLQVEIPDGFVMLIFSRSGHGFKNNMRLANCVGVIDSDYRGEIKVKLTNDNNLGMGNVPIIYSGDRIAQGMLIPVKQVEFELVTTLSETARGAGGLGSTGK